MGAAAFGYDTGRFGVAGDVLFMGEQYADESNETEIPDYTVVNLRGVVRRGAGEEVYITVLNVFDEAYSTIGFFDGFDHVFYPAPGRRVEGGFRVRF